MKKSNIILFFANIALIIGFGSMYLSRQNYEFIIYVSVIIVFLALIMISIRKVDYTLAALVGLTIWSGLHLAGGIIMIGEGRLYELMLIPISDTYPIFRYDQFVHIWGFGSSTLIAFSLLSKSLKRPFANPIALSIVLVMAGLGIGALNEILEFIVSICVPESEIGGYINTSLDLCADLLGGLLGLAYIRLRYWRTGRS